MLRRTNLDLLVVALLALIAALLPSSLGVAQQALAALLVLVLPGYALVIASFPRNELRTAERVLLTLAGSVALAVLGGILLNWTPWGLTAGAWRVFLAGLTLVAVGVAAWRRREIADRPVTRPLTSLDSITVRDGVMMMGAVLLIGLALGLGGLGAPERQTGTFTQLWAAPEQRQGEPGLRVAMRSYEKAPELYRLAIVSNTRTIREWRDVTLEPGQTWEAWVNLPADVPAAMEEAPVEALLYRQDDPALVYRRVRIEPGTLSLP